MKIALFIDGYFFYKSCLMHSVEGEYIAQPNYLRLREYVEDICRGSIVDAHLFTSMNINDANGLVDVVTGESERFPSYQIHNSFYTTDVVNWPPEQGSGLVIHPKTRKPLQLSKERCTDVSLVFHLMRSYQEHRWNRLAIACGDVDFVEPLEWLVDRGVDLYLIGDQDSMSRDITTLASWVVNTNESAVQSHLIYRKSIDSMVKR